MSWVDVIAVAIGIALSWIVARDIEPIALDQATRPNPEAAAGRLRVLFRIALTIMRFLAK